MDIMVPDITSRKANDQNHITHWLCMDCHKDYKVTRNPGVCEDCDGDIIAAPQVNFKR